MRIAVIGSNNGSKQVKNVLIEFLDNITVECFEDTSQYVHIVSTRNWKIDRIIILQDGLPKSDTRNALIRFQQFVDECDLRTNIIFIIKDLNVATNLSDIFVSLYHCIYHTLTIKPTQIVHLGSKPIEDLRESYGYKIKELTNTVSEIEVLGKKEEKVEKKGIFSSLFGKKDKKNKKQEVKESKNEDIEMINELPSLDDTIEANSGVPKFEDTIENNVIDTIVETNRKNANNFYNVGTDKQEDFDRNNHNFSNNAEEINKNKLVEDKEQEEETSTMVVNVDNTNLHSNNPKENFDNTEIRDTEHINTNNMKFDEEKPLVDEKQQDLKAFQPTLNNKDNLNIIDDTIVVSDELYQVFENDETEQQEVIKDLYKTNEELKNVNIANTEEQFRETLNSFEENSILIPIEKEITGVEKESSSETVSDFDIEMNLDDLRHDDSTQVINGVESKINELSSKLDGIQKETDYVVEETIIVPEITETNEIRENSNRVEDVKENQLDLNIAKLEAELKNQEIAVIPHTTHEIETQTKQRKQIKGYGGRRNIIFTGDRGTGITSTALTVASMLARKEPTLFVDFDIENNGFVYYATIDNIIEEDDYVQASLVHLTRFDNIKAVAYKFHKGGFDVLMSFFDSGAVDDDITRVQKIITLQKTYKNVVIDCPIDKLHLLRDLIEQSTVMICTRVKLKTLVTTLKQINEIQGDSLKYNLYKNSKFVITDGQHPEYLLRSLLYIKDLFSLDEDEIDWTDIPLAGSTSNMIELLKDIVE